MPEEVLYGGVEAGGTKFRCVVSRNSAEILEERVIDTTTPNETLERVVDFFRGVRDGLKIAALGVASFGPIDPHPESHTYGHITTTPKKGWRNTDVAGYLRASLEVPVAWDTDVNGAAVAEATHGAGRGTDPVVYMTIGTGIGGGAVVDGRPLHGLLHPEMGHVPVRVSPSDVFPGVCPYHGRCLEGLASGPALRARLGFPPEQAREDDPVWELESEYLAQGVVAISYILSPGRIILGGGVMARPGLLGRIRRRVVEMNGDYISHPSLQDEIDRYIVLPELGPRAGVVGAVELARRAFIVAGYSS